MRVHIIDDIDYDCEVYVEGSQEASWCSASDIKYVYEVPDWIVQEYAAINKRREELKGKLLLIERQGPL